MLASHPIRLRIEKSGSNCKPSMIRAFPFGLEFMRQIGRASWLVLVLILVRFGFVGAAEPDSDLKSRLRETQVGADAFVQAVPLPSWTQPLRELERGGVQSAFVIRLDETQFFAGDRPAYLVNRAMQANDRVRLSDAGHMVIVFNPAFQRLNLHKLNIIRGNSVIDRTKEVTPRFLQSEAGAYLGVYAGQVAADIQLEDVRVEDIVQIVYSVDGINPVFGDSYSETAGWDRFDPVSVRRVWLVDPRKRDIAWRMHGDANPGRVDARTFEEGSVRKLLWEQRDLPGVDLEPDIPSDFFPLRFLQFSDRKNWEEVAKWANGLFPVAGAPTAEMSEVAQRIRDLPTKQAQVMAALRWVQEEIRYVSLSFGESSHRPYPYAEVLRRRYGDCKDKTYLLAGLLRLLDIEASPVLVSAAYPDTPRRMLPSEKVFDHVVLRVRIEGKDYYVDGTRVGQQSAIDKLAAVLPGADALVVAPGVDRLIDLPESPWRNVVTHEVTESIRVDSLEGAGSINVRLVFRGHGAEFMRTYFSSLSPDQQRKSLMGDYSRRYPGVDLVDGPAYESKLAENEYVVTFGLKGPKIAESMDGGWAVKYVPATLIGAVNIPKNPKRAFPLAQPGGFGAVRYRLDVTWPENISSAGDPWSKRISNDFFVLDGEGAFRGNRFFLDIRLEAKRRRIEAGELSQMLDEVRKIDQVLPRFAYAGKEQITRDGIFGLGRKSVIDNLRADMEKRIERLSSTLKGGRLEGEDRASALSDRAIAYLDLERIDEAGRDAEEAVKMAPQLASAQMAKADWLASVGKYTEAVKGYSRALTLGAEPNMVYYARGRAHYYAGNFESASGDFGKARQGNSDHDAYPAMWQVWALQRAGKPLPADLKQFAGEAPNGAWPRPALALQAGILGVEEVQAALKRFSGDELLLNSVEANFYIGQYHLLTEKRLDKAKAAFTAVREVGMSPYVEHAAAGVELRRLAEDHPQR